MEADRAVDLADLGIPELRGWRVYFVRCDHPSTRGTDRQAWQLSLFQGVHRRSVIDVLDGGLAPHLAIQKMLLAVLGTEIAALYAEAIVEHIAGNELDGLPILAGPRNTPRQPR